MRLALALALALLLLGPVAIPSARADRSLPRTIEPAQVTERMTLVGADIRACYLDTVGQRRGVGRLEIELAIHQSGELDRITVRTPGLPRRLATTVDRCVRATVTGLAFPKARTPTIAVVPYFFQRTAAPNAGPQYSCWDPNGCPSRTAKRRAPHAKSSVRPVQARRAAPRRR